jgi:hypothetical protein
MVQEYGERSIPEALAGRNLKTLEKFGILSQFTAFGSTKVYEKEQQNF